MKRQRRQGTHISSHVQIALMTATHCCVCKAILTDAESLELGLGPICSRKFYKSDIQPTVESVRNALGLIAISGLPERIIEEFVRVVNNNHANARLGSNVLVYWASCNYQDRDEVFKCSSIVRTLGYKELADKLEMDRTVASIKDGGNDRIEVFVADPYSFHKDLVRVAGIEPLPDTDATPTGHPTGQQAKRGHKFGWTIPKASRDHLDWILGIHYGGELACNEKGIYTIPRRRRYDLDAFLHPASKVPTAASQGIIVATMPGASAWRSTRPSWPRSRTS